MKIKKIPFKHNFKVLLGNRHSQAAEMVLAPGESSEPGGNRHKGADQWLYVVEGEGVAIINGKSKKLSAGFLVLIEKGDKHEIRNQGAVALKTLNFYVPPAYTSKGDLLPAGRNK